jgi:hypothetical protein
METFPFKFKILLFRREALVAKKPDEADTCLRSSISEAASQLGEYF